MWFRTALSTETDLEQACREAASLATKELDDVGDGGGVDLCIAFASPSYGSLDGVGDLLSDCTGARRLVGCSGGGIIGAGLEVEGHSAVSVTVARLPGVDVAVRHLLDEALPDPDAPPHAWAELLGASPDSARGFVVMPEPFSFRADVLLAGLDYAFPHAPKVGGIASGGEHPGGNALLVDRGTHSAGAAVLALSGAIDVTTVVAQGCKPFGRAAPITRCEGHHLHTIEGKPAVEFLREQIESIDGSDLELARRSPLFLGIAMDPFRMDAPGAGDFLVRNLIGHDRTTGMLAVGERLATGRIVQFHLRDARTSAQDLRASLDRGRREQAPRGALLFSCLGRGSHLYGVAGHDSRVFKERIGDAPLAGFFCNGEIGPVGGATHLHGYTSAFALLHPRQERA